MRLKLIATTTFGLEAVAKREIQALGYEIESVSDGKITYIADERGIVRSNLWLRTADRVLLKIDEFRAEEFEDLFQRVKGYPWEELIELDGKFTVNGVSVKSKLSSVPACQSIVKKAIVERMKDVYGVERFEESGSEYTVKVSLLKDVVTVTVDTTGTGLHKRGYRTNPVAAPIKETMAAAMIMLTYWNENRLLVDPFCGSGTIPIEAAMIASNIAPGLNRTFASEGWSFIDKGIWSEERKRAYGEIKQFEKLKIYGYDIDEKALKASMENSEAAGVDHLISFKKVDVKKMAAFEDEGIIITNPPYAQRIGDRDELEKIYRALNKFFLKNPTWSLFMITTDDEIEEKIMDRKADRRRKLYNGRLKTCYYQFHGKRK